VGSSGLTALRLSAEEEGEEMGIQLHVSTSGYCNAKCNFCIYNSEENKMLPKGFMQWDLYEKIIRDAATIEHIDNIAFSGLSEPLTDKLLEKRIALAKELRPDWFIETYTNGTLLSPDRFESLKAVGIDNVNISLNAVTQEQHEKIMGLKGQYATVLRNALYAKANRGNVRLLVKAVVNGDNFTRDHSTLFLGLWGRIDEGDGVGALVLEANWAGGNRLIEERKPDFDVCCGRALGQISIHWDGRVGLCCFDPLVKYPFGDLKKQTIREIYNSDKYVQFREWHDKNEASKHPLCAKCTRV
jgi:MoaA/NifB/PqqE/SkfB family radical SAM enzyme